MLIVLEGLDGAGKSTQLKKISSYLQQKGANVRYAHFPMYETHSGDLVARFLRGDFGKIEGVHPMLVALLFAENRRDAAPLLREWLDAGDVVILDRYVYSNIAFQCAKLNAEKEAQELREWILDTEFGFYAIPKPDINIFLDVPLGFVSERLKGSRKGDDREYLKGKADIHEESMEFQRRVRECYLEQCSADNNFIRITCSDEAGEMLTENEIFEKLIDHLGTEANR